ncbi:MAG: hypothetical protein AAF578_00240 [Pseudomonadota bacterium]
MTNTADIIIRRAAELAGWRTYSSYGYADPIGNEVRVFAGKDHSKYAALDALVLQVWRKWYARWEQYPHTDLENYEVREVLRTDSLEALRIMVADLEGE